ncbi:sensor domain-containing diguanylate cyclase [Pseudomonas panipatensis]|uniref:diguanylate cyclase n=1 Tax=Pseudomonas panipatensis TaxID=428992 RepID=A0A1G8KYT9_9PSED|nr:sensor domain-containing diguanylate cyclase [Pseudomonas panipatensis]SDI48551.1 diguanylate cyclase (GGDEF) domain-containing protein [Pseudomonas panipatensis]SMP72999.1 diguanylate cyclase (GGDEF) domain-containing protein [Pseudomonas panipatensis]
MASSADFESASREVLAFLQRTLGFDLWLVTRVEEDDWIVLESHGQGYALENGRALEWRDSLCSRMVAGVAPRIAPRVMDVPAYATAPFLRQFPIQAYMGLPLYLADGKLFGTLCAFATTPQPSALSAQADLFDVIGMLLSLLLQMEIKAETQTRRAERFEAQALLDAMTGLFNRTGWDQLMAKEEYRCRRHGKSCVVIVVDLDELKQINDSEGHMAGDALIRRTAEALAQAARSEDVVARIGGDEFGIIGVNCDQAGGSALLARVLGSLAEKGIAASVGLAVRASTGDIGQAFIEADRLMYQQKRRKSSQQPLPQASVE